MKSTYLFLIFFIVSYSNAQTENYEIESTFNEYRRLIELKNYDKAFDFYHKSFLKYIPKKDLEKEFTKLDNNPNYTYSVKNSKLLSSSKIIKNDSVNYSILKYGANTHIKFRADVNNDSIQRIKHHFQTLYGNAYTFSKKNNEIITYKEQELIGINDSSWRFIIYKDKLKPYMSIWLPEKVLDSLLLMR
jgi:hypothetical protein